MSCCGFRILCRELRDLQLVTLPIGLKKVILQELYIQTFNKTIELAEEKQVAIKAEKIIDELKGRITN
ncbi:MAG: hypothetical protein ACJ0DJ_13350 [bacterium]